jgi:hypothetical protein
MASVERFFLIVGGERSEVSKEEWLAIPEEVRDATWVEYPYTDYCLRLDP